jgi:hypothetical protein
VAEYRFALAGVTLAGTGPLLGVWEVPPAAAESFGVPAGATWRVQLPASPREAGALLEQKRLALRRSEVGLVEAERRLSRVAAVAGGGPRIADPAGAAEGAVGGRRIADAFGAGEGAAGGPEARLLRALQAIEGPASFATDWHSGAEQRQVSQRWRDFLGQACTLVSHAMCVETDVAGALVGRTTVGWAGDFDTRWEPHVAPLSMALHRQAVHLALASRIALVRLLIVVGAGAAKLALRLTIPGAQLLVLPAAWRFVQDVLKELQAWREVG